VRRFVLAVCVGWLAGCAATTRVDLSGPRAAADLCRPKLPALVLWTTHWRPDQKDVAEREAAAWQGIQQFFVRSSCFGTAEIRSAEAIPAETSAFGRVIAVTVRELGPVVRIGSPSLLEGGTEAVLEIKVLDGRTRETLADQRVHWQNGGPFVVKGVATLQEDMAAALAAAFKSPSELDPAR
jgi:hypothetical protein